MSKRVVRIALPLILAAILAALSFSGCGGKPAGAPAEQELPQILSDSLLASQNAGSYTYSQDMSIAFETTGGSNPSQATATLQSNGAADLTANNMKMDLAVSVNRISTSNQSENMAMNASAEMYMMADTLYIKTDMPGTSEQWFKTPLTDQVKQAYELDIVNQQFAPLETATRIEYVKTETVDGSDCYVLKIVPDMAGMKDWLNQQVITSELFDWGNVENLEDIFKELAYNTWIAKDTKLIIKMNINMNLETTPTQLGVAASEFDKMTMDVEINMLMNDYNQPVSIVLPNEAENATEM